MDFILWLQGFSSPALDRFFVGITGMGSEQFYLALIPIVYWTVDRRVGIRLGLLFLASVFLNFFLKDFLRLPRPQGPGLRVIFPESGTGYGFPSFHAQGNATIWGYLYATYRRRWLLAWAVLATGAVALSRIYLGLHYPADVLGGIAIGVVLILAFQWATGLTERLGIGTGVQAAAAVLVPLAALSLYHTDQAYRMAGMAIGLGLGYLWQESRLRFDARAGLPGQLVKVLIGVAGVFAVRLATDPFFPEGPAQVVRYALVGLWAAYGAPAAFVATGLSRPGRTEGLSQGRVG